MRFDLCCTQKKLAPLSHIHSNNPPLLPQPTSADTHLHNKLGNHNFVIITSCKGMTVFSFQIAGNLKVGFVFLNIYCKKPKTSYPLIPIHRMNGFEEAHTLMSSLQSMGFFTLAFLTWSSRRRSNRASRKASDWEVSFHFYISQHNVNVSK
jgi:hypothetical protein